MILAEPTSVEAKEALIAKHLLSAVKAVLVHELSNKGTRGPLVLHTSLHQVDRVNCRRSRSCANVHKIRLNRIHQIKYMRC